jgi:hypothetical protein
MFSSIFITVLAAASMVSARMDARSHHRRSDAPSTYAEGYLERYDVYHARYMALDCNTKHNTDFFTACCHPLLATETLASRPAECNPDAAKTAAAKATPTPSDDDEECEEGTEDCVCEGDDEEHSSTPAPTPTPKVVKPTTTTKPKAIAKATIAPSSGGSVHTGGVATYFWQGGVAGACGTVHSDSDYIAAIDQNLYGNSGDASQYCGKQIKITRTDTGKTVTVTVADDCPSCINTNSIDLSHAAFDAIATDAEGEVPISWVWL